MTKLSNTERTAIICFITIIIIDIVLISVRLTQYFKARTNMKQLNFINPVSGRVTSTFGSRTHPVTGKTSSYHNGVDIAVPTGTPIISPADGTVTTVNKTTAGGLQVIITHTNGWKTGYAHLSSQLVRQGQAVRQGETIALSGNTGQTTGPHLHFTLTDPSGNKVNPLEYFTF